MREILFRGKRDKKYDRNQDWVYGVPCIDNEGDCIMVDDCSRRVVIPETVGQYTGLTDKNGKKIFEGDILQVCRGNDIDTGYVLYDERMASYSISVTKNECLLFIDWFIAKQEDNRVWIEIIGNIHDNPELLINEKGSEKK